MPFKAGTIPVNVETTKTKNPGIPDKIRTKTEIPSGNDNEEVQNMHWVRRAGLTTAIYKDKQLQSLNLWPIIPEQSERLFKEQKLPKDASEF